VIRARVIGREAQAQGGVAIVGGSTGATEEPRKELQMLLPSHFDSQDIRVWDIDGVKNSIAGKRLAKWGCRCDAKNRIR
jgi:hypothetical protein